VNLHAHKLYARFLILAEDSDKYIRTADGEDRATKTEKRILAMNDTTVNLSSETDSYEITRFNARGALALFRAAIGG
jgi:hypothetical protein